jgi:hypothetical protein
MSTVACGKRAGNDHLPPLFLGTDVRSWRVALLLVALAILNAFDLAYSLFAERISQLHEMNPLMAPLLDQGPLAFAAIKILLVLCGLSLLWKLRYCRLTIPACWVLFIAYVSLSVVWVQWVHMVNAAFEVRLSSALP